MVFFAPGKLDVFLWRNYVRKTSPLRYSYVYLGKFASVLEILKKKLLVEKKNGYFIILVLYFI